MGIRKIDADHDFSAVGKIIRALHNPVAADVSSPVDGEIWYRTDTDQYRGRRNGVSDSFAMMSDVTAGGVSASLWDAQSVVIAVTDNTPVAQALAASTVLGRRASGDITAVSFANLLTDLMAITAFETAVDARVTNGINTLVDGAPGALDTLNELAAAINDDASFSATVTTALGLRTRKYANNYGNGSLTTFTVNHALGTTDVVAQVRLNSNGQVLDAVIDVVDANNIEIVVNTVYSTDAIRVVVIG